MWKARDLIRCTCSASVPAGQSEHVAALRSCRGSAVAGAGEMVQRLEILSAIIGLMSPIRETRDLDLTKTLHHRVAADDDNAPTEYAVGFRPNIIPCAAIRRWSCCTPARGRRGDQRVGRRAARRGYILFAPEYMTAGRAARISLHAERACRRRSLRLRDARKRYSIDSDRVFVAGQLIGGNMAWDLRLAHPDLSPASVVISGLPAKYVPRYPPHHERLPLYCVIGDLAPAANDFIFEQVYQAADLEDVGHHLRRVLSPRPRDLARGDRCRLRLDGPPPPRSVSQVVQSCTRPASPTTASTASWCANSRPAEPRRPEAVECWARTSTQPRSR